MYAPTFNGFAAWLVRRGVRNTVAMRAEYLNRNVTVDMAAELAADSSMTYSQQAATALHVAFDYRDTREGREFWLSVERDLEHPNG